MAIKTSLPKIKEIERQWYIVDAADKVLGRLSASIAAVLRGKNKAYFTPHIDCGDYVIVINAANIKLTGNKGEDKMYYSHSGFKGGITSISANKLLKKDATQLIYKAVYGMLPTNRLRNGMIERLKIFATDSHPHAGQNPKHFEI